MPVDLGETNIDPTGPKYRSMLENLQGNILKSHGRKESDHLFLRFTGDRASVRAWIRQFADEVTSARQQFDAARSFRATGTPGAMFAGMYLSSAGYRALGLGTTVFGAAGQSFRNGMKHRSFSLLARNRDPPSSEWEGVFRGAVDAMLALGHESKGKLEAKTYDVSESLDGIASILTVERATVLRNATGESIEHFGYVDGRSQPLFFKDDIERERRDGVDRWDPAAPLGLILVRDPHTEAEDAFGSYLVFRKLRQDVAAFNAQVSALAARLSISDPLAGALVVGRFKDGTPVTLQATDGRGAFNDFTYLPADPIGSRCPFHAHIRKANQRGSNEGLGLEEERKRRIARRGIPYGIRPPGSREVGLLFQAFQSDIARQFEFIQRTWVDNPNFPEFRVIPGLNSGDDALIGQHPIGVQRWPRDWGKSGRFLGRRIFNFGGHVRLRGGEYFFAPSLPFLRSL